VYQDWALVDELFCAFATTRRAPSRKCLRRGQNKLLIPASFSPVR
jgi:hypothetical protein